MKNFIAANASDYQNPFAPPGRYSLENIKILLNAQIENSIKLGWEPKDIIVVANFVHKFMEVETIRMKFNDYCYLGSNTFGMKYLFDNDMVDDVIWSHDLDAWQNVELEIPKFKDVGIAYSLNDSLEYQYNTASVFWRENTKDIIDSIVFFIEKYKIDREEPPTNVVLKSEIYKDRVTIINPTYNLGCFHYDIRRKMCTHPIQVCHFHPDREIHWQKQILNSEKFKDKGITDRLENLLRRYFPHLPNS